MTVAIVTAVMIMTVAIVTTASVMAVVHGDKDREASA